MTRNSNLISLHRNALRNNMHTVIIRYDDRDGSDPAITTGRNHYISQACPDRPLCALSMIRSL